MPSYASFRLAVRLTVALGIAMLAIPPVAQSQGNLGSSCLSRVFGPETYVRNKGGPVTVVREFTTDLFEPPFVLHLVNGDPDGGNRVSSAEVWLNGQLLFPPSAFSQQARGDEMPVSLMNPSRIEVRLAGKPGSHLKIWIAGASSVVSPFEPLLVSPEGGRYTLTTGPVLYFPAGAVQTPTTIGACLSAEPLVTPVLESYGLVRKFFMGGVELSPPDLLLDTPITVVLPVRRPQWTSQVPVLLAVNTTTGLYSVAPQDLVYHPGGETITMMLPPTNPTVGAAKLASVSPVALADSGGTCKRDKLSWQVAGSDSPEIVSIDCTLPANRNSCACGDLKVTSISEELAGGGAGGECYYITDTLLVKYLDRTCRGLPEFTVSVREYEVATPDIEPRPIKLRRCETQQARATVCSESGRRLPATFVRWELREDAVSISPTTGATTIVTAGSETGTAIDSLTALGGCGASDQTQIDVAKIKLDVEILDAPAKMVKNQKETLTATVTEQGRPLNCETITWTSDNPGVVAVDDGGRITANSPGTARITAEPSSAPEDSASVDIKVVRPRWVVMDPPAEWINVNQEIAVSAEVLDDDSQPMTGIPVTWSVSNGHIALVSSQADPPRAKVRGDSVGTAEVTATVIEFPDVHGEAPITVSGLSVTSVSPTTTTDCRTESVTITGTGFQAGAHVGFQGPGSISLGGVQVASETTITGGTQSGMDPGKYDVVVTNPGGQSASLPKAFEVKPCGDTVEISWNALISDSVSWTDSFNSSGAWTTVDSTLQWKGSWSGQGSYSVSDNRMLWISSAASVEQTMTKVVTYDCGSVLGVRSYDETSIHTRSPVGMDQFLKDHMNLVMGAGREYIFDPFGSENAIPVHWTNSITRRGQSCFGSVDWDHEDAGDGPGLGPFGMPGNIPASDPEGMSFALSVAVPFDAVHKQMYANWSIQASVTH